MSGRGRGKQLTRPAWMQDSHHPAPSVSRHPHTAKPVDWVQARAADGRPYWYSLSTGQTTWNDPTIPTSQPPDSSKSLPPEWQQLRADDGRTYYYNSATKKTQWSPPVNSQLPAQPKPSFAASSSPLNQVAAVSPVSGPTSVSHHALPNGWAEHRTQDGRTYFYHSPTRETRWERPVLNTSTLPTNQRASGIKRPAASLSHSEELLTPAHLSPDWAESRTSDGKIYYYNKVTRETSWTAPTAQSNLKRPRVTAPIDRRTMVDHARQQKREISRKPDNPKHLIKRPRSSEGKPLTDRQAENYFLRRAKARGTFSEMKEDEDAHNFAVASSSLANNVNGEIQFRDLLKDKCITEKMSWLEVMSQCATDPRFLLVSPYGKRKHRWMVFTQKLAKDRRRKEILSRRRITEEFEQLLTDTFATEPYNVISMNRCRPELVKSLESDIRYKGVSPREREVLIKSFFSARARKGAIEHTKRRKEALDIIRRTLDKRIHPKLLPDNENIDAMEGVQQSQTAAATQRQSAQGLHENSPDYVKNDTLRYFDDHTDTRELEEFIESLPQSSTIEKSDFPGLVRSWKRHIHSLVRERRARERESRLLYQRECRAAFRNGVENMLLSGQLSLNPRWKEVCKRIAEEKFAKPEAELDARAVDLFDDGVRLFEERVQSHREEFKRLLRDSGVEITQKTTIDKLRENESLARFLKQFGNPVASALLLDRQRKESKRKQKEVDRALSEFSALLRRSDVSDGTSFETAMTTMEKSSSMAELQSVVEMDRLKKSYDEFMHWKREKEDRRMKRKLEQHQAISYTVTGFPNGESAKRARVSMNNHDTARFSGAQQQEEENGWAAAVSAKPVNEADKLKERERRKRELLESHSNTQT